MELERSYNAQRERQKRMLELPQKAVHIGWIKLLDYLFNYPGLCYADEHASVLLRNRMAIVHSRFYDLHASCSITRSISI